MTEAVEEVLRYAHWRDAAHAHECAKDVYHYMQTAAAMAPIASTEIFEIVRRRRVYDAFAPLDKREIAPGEITFAGQPDVAPEVYFAFEAMLLAGEVEAAYNYVCGSRHGYVTFNEIICEHSPDYAQTKRGDVQLARSAVRVVKAYAASVTSWAGGDLIASRMQ
jgi:hypothetical protein